MTRELPGGKLEDVVRGEHLRKTAVVCDCGCDDAKVSSSLENVYFVQHVAYALYSEEESHKGQVTMIRTNSQKHERQCEEEEQGTKTNRFTERADAMRHEGALSERFRRYCNKTRAKGARVKNKTHKNKNVTIIQARR